VLPYPTGSHVILADLGSDCLWQFRLDTQTGALEPADMASVSVPPGTGPRHFAFHPTASFLYLLGELASTIHVFRRDDSAARLEPVAQYSSLPEDFDGDSTGAQILLSADGRFVYASNRGHDSIVIMAVDAETGRLSLVGHQSVHGQTPRNFNFDASGNFVLCANQDSDNIVVFERDGDKGTLTYVSEVATPAPVCIYPA
jgi:6-phosphogluconolactonase